MIGEMVLFLSLDLPTVTPALSDVPEIAYVCQKMSHEPEQGIRPISFLFLVSYKHISDSEIKYLQS